MPRPIRFLRPLAVVGLALLIPRPVTAQAPALPPDLALVHPDSLGFAHVRLAEIWANPAMKDLRKVVAKAGPAALGALDEQFVPKPTTVDRVTIIVPSISGNGQPRLVGAIHFSAPFDADLIRKTYLPKGKASKVGGKELFSDEDASLAVYFPDNQTLVFSEPETLAEYLTWAPKTEGGLRETVTAATRLPVAAAVNIGRLPLPPGLEENVPEEFRPLVKARVLALTLGMAEESTLTAKLSFANGEQAMDGEKAIRKGLDLLRGELARPRQEAERVLGLAGNKVEKTPRPLEDLPEAVAAVLGLGALGTLDEILADPPVKRDGSAVAATVTLPSWMTQYLGTSALSAGLMLPAVQKVRFAASRSVATNNMKQIGLAMHNYADTFNGFPPAAIVDKKGKKLLSWRVAILPYIEQNALYRQFKLDEPWDSEHNLKLSKIIPKVYVDPRLPGPTAAGEGKTYYKLLVGKDATFDWVKSRKFPEITDGTSNTIMVVAAGDPVIWSKPDDIEFDAEKPAPDLSKPFKDLIMTFCDGSVRTFAADHFKTREKTLKALITAAGGEPVNADE